MVKPLAPSDDRKDKLEIGLVLTSSGLGNLCNSICEGEKSKLWLSFESVIKLFLANRVAEPFSKMIPDKLIAPVK